MNKSQIRKAIKILEEEIETQRKQLKYPYKLFEVKEMLEELK